MKWNAVQTEDYQNLGSLDFIDWEQFRNKLFLITGATGLIGSNLVYSLAFNSRKKNLGIRFVLPVRDTEKAGKMFSGPDIRVVSYPAGGMTGAGISADAASVSSSWIFSEEYSGKNPDFIVHLASPTDSSFFIKNPVDTILANVEGTRLMLELARKHPVSRFVYLSSMETYGFPERGHRVTENDPGAFDPLNPRNSYPVAKTACEALCKAYYVQYMVPSIVIRAAQTFGPGVQYQDGRVFAQFMRCAAEKKDIVLRSEGLTERSYLYTADAVSAILAVLQKGCPGQAYSAANPDTYISIRDMAEMVAEEIAGGSIHVIFDLAEDIEKEGYAKTLYMDLDVSKLRTLGWHPGTGLKEMYERMIRSFSPGQETMQI